MGYNDLYMSLAQYLGRNPEAMKVVQAVAKFGLGDSFAIREVEFNPDRDIWVYGVSTESGDYLLVFSDHPTDNPGEWLSEVRWPRTPISPWSPFPPFYCRVFLW